MHRAVPPSNSDNSGPLRVADVRGWLHDAILNRGASVQIGSPFDRILLAGDGWWAEPDIGEWLWLGDYVWQSKDRAGRLALAAAIEFEGARWIVIGDNSPFINSQVFADPRALIRIIELASLWPTLATDLLLVLVGGALSFAVGRPHWQPHLQFFAVSILLTAAIAGAYLSMAPGTKWSDVYVGESGHDPRNFNGTLATHPELLKHGRMLRFKHALAGKHSLPKGRVVIFMLVDGAVELDGIKLSNCRRLGSLATGEGIYLMDAQACRADGSAVRVLIGDQNNAAVLTIQRDDGEAIIVLDTAFLSRNAPAGNVKWLLSKMDQ